MDMNNLSYSELQVAIAQKGFLPLEEGAKAQLKNMASNGCRFRLEENGDIFRAYTQLKLRSCAAD